MDGILEELLRLEDVKHHALIDIDPAAYERSVRAQLDLADDPRISIEARSGSDKLLAFSKLARLNAGLYQSLLSTAPWLIAANKSYTGHGRIAETSVTRSFSAEA